ncbi:LPD29 domain-containing protein [Burkholderia multivorans]|uniref:LPD29 domain-containing protein n=1 Tax=Burkholderia multivorans TaxID=87883 RepID=UPI000B2F94AD|nr:LPD29 domain-containing protein [Burkholderia multivorans]
MSHSHDPNRLVSVGQRIHSILYGGRDGIVYAIHGEQHPETVQSLAHVVMRGGGAEFDIVFDNGTMSYRLPECILRGVQWRIYADIATADDIAAALANAATTQAHKAAQVSEAKQRDDDERAHLAKADAYRHLKQGTDVYSGKLAAANMRIELKRAFPGVKFSVRMTYHGAVSVCWTDGPRQAKVDAICRKYKAGRFNSMEDSYEHATQPWHHVFGGLEYLSVSRDESAALVAQAIEAVYAEYADKLASVSKPAPEQFKRGELIHVCVPDIARDLHTLICTQLRDVA